MFGPALLPHELARLYSQCRLGGNNNWGPFNQILQDSSPQPFWHQGLVSWKSVFSRTPRDCVCGMIQHLTFIVHFLSIIITSAPLQIIRHQIPEVEDPCFRGNVSSDLRGETGHCLSSRDPVKNKKLFHPRWRIWVVMKCVLPSTLVILIQLAFQQACYKTDLPFLLSEVRVRSCQQQGSQCESN